MGHGRSYNGVLWCITGCDTPCPIYGGETMPLKPDRERDEVVAGADARLFRPHTHCPDCWSEGVVVIAGVLRCPKCESNPAVVVCTPIICASS